MGVHFNGAPKLYDNALFPYAVCQAAGAVSEALGEELKPVLDMTHAIFNMGDAGGVVGHTYTLWSGSEKKPGDGTPETGVVLVVKRVFYATVGVFLTLKVLTVKMGVGLKALRTHAPRFARILSSKAFPQVFCVMSVARRVMQIRDNWYSSDAKEQEQFWSKSVMLLGFSAFDISYNLADLIPAVALAKRTHGMMLIGSALAGCVQVGTQAKPDPSP